MTSARNAEELGDAVPGGDPRDVRRAEARAARRTPSNNGIACVAPELHRAERPAELDDLHARPQLRQPLLVPGELRRPHGGLEPEGDRQPGLAVGAPAHHGVAVAPGERHTARRRHAGDVPFDDVADPPQTSRTRCRRGPARSRRSTPTPAPRSGSISRRRRISPRVECPEERVPSATTARSSRSIVACSSISAAASAGTSPTSAWACGERGEDVSQADVRPWSSKSVVQLGRGPEMAVDRGVGEVGTHRSSFRRPSRTSSRLAPHGTTAVSPSTSSPRSIRQHLVSTLPAASGAGARAQVDPLGLVAVEVPVELQRALAADEQPVAALGRPGVQVGHRGAAEVDARAPARQQVGAARDVPPPRPRPPRRPGSARSAAGPRRTRPPARPGRAASAGSGGTTSVTRTGSAPGGA